MQPRADAVLRLEVKDDAVQPVLEQRPQRIPADRQGERHQHAHFRKAPARPARRCPGRRSARARAGARATSASSTRDSNIGGDARSTSVRLRRALVHVFAPSPSSSILLRLRTRHKRLTGVLRASTERYDGSPTATSASVSAASAGASGVSGVAARRLAVSRRRRARARAQSRRVLRPLAWPAPRGTRPGEARLLRCYSCPVPRERREQA